METEQDLEQVAHSPLAGGPVDRRDDGGAKEELGACHGRLDHEPRTRPTGDVTHEQLVRRLLLDPPCGELSNLTSRKLASLRIRGGPGKEQPNQRSLQLEYAAGVERLDELRVRNRSGYLDCVAVRVRAASRVRGK